MIENYKNEIINILQRAGDQVSEQDSMTYVRLGEGMGYCSDLFTVFIGSRKYAVKITDSILRGEQMAKTVVMPEKHRAIVTTAFEQSHNREMQVYEWFKEFLESEATSPYSSDLDRMVRFYGGTYCKENEAGIIIMDDLSSQSYPIHHLSITLPLSTIFSAIEAVAAFQSAYLSTEAMIYLVAKDVFFEIGSSSILGCVERISEKKWISEKWKGALRQWTTPEELRRVQYERKAGDPMHTLCHTDLWTNNLLFSNEDNQLRLLAILDWQAATVGNPLLDVATIIAYNLHPKERKAHERDILQFYVDSIRKRSHRFKKEFPIEESTDKILPAYRSALRFAALQLVLQLGYRPEEDVVDETDELNEERLGIYSERLKAILEEIVD